MPTCTFKSYFAYFCKLVLPPLGIIFETYLFTFSTDINECNVTEPCQNNGTCENTYGSYVCHCQAGWQDTNCHKGEDSLPEKSFNHILEYFLSKIAIE